MKKTTVKAFSNIALIKYWGKRDEKLILPQNSSFSVALSNLFSKTTVHFSKRYKRDLFFLNQKEFASTSLEFAKVARVLAILRRYAKTRQKAKIVSENNFPTAAGLASSASGLSALTVALAKALDLNLSSKQLSIVARQGSGSACRSVMGGFVLWKKGSREDGSDSFAQEIKTSNFSDIKIIVCLVTSKEKKVKSSIGMKETVTTSAYYQSWPEDAEKDVKKIKQALFKNDFWSFGELAERNALKMHALMMTSKPPIVYMLPQTVTIMKKVWDMREKGLPVFFTMDAGPQVKVICQEKDLPRVKNGLSRVGAQNIIVNGLSGQPEFLKTHLF
ncbi:diphosphomevalonate decarboxylase [Patescibacteria group bacterium]|nr:diphosphomevalonate decarboxylase [Patescibacteria group bacterium]